MVLSDDLGEEEFVRLVSGWLAGSGASQRRADEATPDELLGYVTKLEALAGTVQLIQHDAVSAARSAGCSWTQVGDALGVSKQAAQQRFRVRLDEPASRDLRVLGPIGRDQELEALAEAGREGWRLKESRTVTHVLEWTGEPWEIVRRSLFQPTIMPHPRDGWVAASVRFPDAFYQRPMSDGGGAGIR